MRQADFITVALAAEAAGERTQWVHYLPNGRFEGRGGDARGPWRLTDPAAFIAASLNYAGGKPIPVDYDHALEAALSERRTPAPAAGWVTELAARPDGIWGLTEWTPRAASQIADKEYRFVSPVFFHSKEGEVKEAYALKAAALTNQPALNSLTAVCSMERPSMDLDELCRQLRAALGLSDSAQPDAIVEAVTGLRSTATSASERPAPDRFVPIEQFERVVASLNAQSRGVSQEAAELAVDRAVESGKLLPALREWGVSLCAANKPAFDGFIDRTAGGLQQMLGPLPQTRGVPRRDTSISSMEREIASRCGLTPEDLARVES